MPITPVFLYKYLPDVKIIVKSADEIVNNSNALQDDDEFQFPIAAGERKWIQMWIFFRSSAVADWKCGWSIPANTTLYWTSSHDIGGETGGSAMSPMGGANTTLRNGSGVAVTLLEMFWGLIVSTTGAGTVKYQWCQNTAEATDTKVLADSLMLINKL